jgi:hypothetical protein
LIESARSRCAFFKKYHSKAFFGGSFQDRTTGPEDFELLFVFQTPKCLVPFAASDEKGGTVRGLRLDDGDEFFRSAMCTRGLMDGRGQVRGKKLESYLQGLLVEAVQKFVASPRSDVKVIVAVSIFSLVLRC